MNEEKNILSGKQRVAGHKAEDVHHFPEDSHAPQIQTSNIPPQTENMEVHKHPHHVTHKKKWGEYFINL